MVETIGLSNFVQRPVEQYSRGMRQKLHFARALLASPELLLLDEPTAGLDPESAYEMRKTIQGLQSSGTSFVVTSHSLMEVQSLCQHVSVLRRGVQVALGTPDRLLGGMSLGATVDEYLVEVADLQQFRNAVDLGGVARVVERWDGENWRCSVVHDATWSANLGAYQLHEQRAPSTEEAYLLALLLPELT